MTNQHLKSKSRQNQRDLLQPISLAATLAVLLGLQTKGYAALQDSLPSSSETQVAEESTPSIAATVIADNHEMNVIDHEDAVNIIPTAVSSEIDLSFLANIIPEENDFSVISVATSEDNIANSDVFTADLAPATTDDAHSGGGDIPLPAAEEHHDMPWWILLVGAGIAGIIISSDGSSCPPPPTFTPNMDFGDAPDSYGTTLANDGAYHIIVNGLFIGSVAPDAEADGQPTLLAMGDDFTNVDDEGFGTEGDPFFFTDGGTYLVVPISANGGSAYLQGWIDYDDSGTFDVNEALFGVPIMVVDGSNMLPILIPPPQLTLDDDLIFRLRLSTDMTAVSSPEGPAPDGEVEDHCVHVINNFEEFSITRCQEISSDIF